MYNCVTVEVLLKCGFGATSWQLMCGFGATSQLREDLPPIATTCVLLYGLRQYLDLLSQNNPTLPPSSLPSLFPSSYSFSFSFCVWRTRKQAAPANTVKFQKKYHGRYQVDTQIDFLMIWRSELASVAQQFRGGNLIPRSYRNSLIILKS